MESALEVVNKFYDVCNNKQGRGLRDYIADDIVFEGPVLKISGGDKYGEIVEPLCKFHKGIQMFKQFEDAGDVISIYEMILGTPSGETLKISFADWITVRNGRIVKQKLYYDPREFIKAFNI